MENEPKHIYLSIFPPRKTAVTIYPYIFWSKSKKGWENIYFIKHEMYHWNEQKEWKENEILGLSRWLTVYCVKWFWFNFHKKLPLDKHPMEAPAYRAGKQAQKQ